MRASSSGHAPLRPRPVSASAFKAGTGASNVTVSKASLVKMDALASDGHIGLIYATNPDGTDQIIEAKGEDYGTNIWTRAYRGNSSYTGVRRTGWSSSVCVGAHVISTLVVILVVANAGGCSRDGSPPTRLVNGSPAQTPDGRTRRAQAADRHEGICGSRLRESVPTHSRDGASKCRTITLLGVPSSSGSERLGRA